MTVVYSVKTCQLMLAACRYLNIDVKYVRLSVIIVNVCRHRECL